MSLPTYCLEEGKVELAGVAAAHDVGGVGEEAHGEAEGVHGHGVRARPHGAVPEAGRPARLDVRVAATATATQGVSSPLKHDMAGLAGSQLDCWALATCLAPTSGYLAGPPCYLPLTTRRLPGATGPWIETELQWIIPLNFGKRLKRDSKLSTFFLYRSFTPATKLNIIENLNFFMYGCQSRGFGVAKRIFIFLSL